MHPILFSIKYLEKFLLEKDILNYFKLLCFKIDISTVLSLIQSY